MKFTETPLSPRYSETDQMGIIYHANYFIYFDVGRTDFLKKCGLRYREMEAAGIMLPVIEVNCKYKVSARYDEDLIVRTRIEKLTPTRIKFNYAILGEDYRVVMAEGFTEHVFLNKKTGKPINLKKLHPEVYLKLEGLV